jgi:multidrug efflux pump subunit AcrB
MGMRWIEFSLKNRHAVLAAALALCLLGLAVLPSVTIDILPDFKKPVVVSFFSYPGLPTIDMEQSVTTRIERILTLAGKIEHQESRTVPGATVVKVFFQPGTDPSSAMNNVVNLEASDMFHLPPGIEWPFTLRSEPANLPVILAAISGEGLTESQLYTIGYYAIRNKMGGLKGVQIPHPFGGKFRQMMIYVDPARLRAHHVSAVDVVEALRKANLVLAGGTARVGGTDYQVQPRNTLPTTDELAAIPVAVRDGRPIFIRDLGRVVDDSALQYNIVRVNGKRSVYCPLLREPGENTINVVDRIRAGVATEIPKLKERGEVPEAAEITLVSDQSRYIRSALANLYREVGLGALLVAVVVGLFLRRLMPTVIILVGMLLAILIGGLGFAFTGQTINVMTLGGIALAIGTAVDAGIVVVENVMRHLRHGKPSWLAARDGTAEVAGAIFAGTITTLAVFLPVVFLTGMIRYLFEPLSLAATFTIGASYVLALTVVPAACASWLQARRKTPLPSTSTTTSTTPSQNNSTDDNSGTDGTTPPLAKSLETSSHPDRDHRGDDNALSDRTTWANQPVTAVPDDEVTRDRPGMRLYSRLLDGTLRAPATTSLVLVLLIATSFGLWPWLGSELFPEVDAGTFEIRLKNLPGADLAETERLVEQVEQTIREVIPPDQIETLIANIGLPVGKGAGFSTVLSSNSGPDTAYLIVNLKTEGRTTRTRDLIARLRAQLASDYPLVNFLFVTGGIVNMALNEGVPTPISIQVSGGTLAQCRATAEQIVDRVRPIPGAVDVQIAQSLDYPQLDVQVDRTRAKYLGVDQEQVAQTVLTALASSVGYASTIWIDPKTGTDFFMGVQYENNQFQSLDEIHNIPIRVDTPQGPLTIPLSNVATVKRVTIPGEIAHYNIGRVVDVHVNIQGRDVGSVARDVEHSLRDLPLPSGLQFRLRGPVATMQSGLRLLGLGLVVATILVYLVLMAQFRSWIDPLIIMLAVPLGIGGSFAVLYLTGSYLSIQSVMGILMMVGVVVNNSILLVEFANQLRATGLDSLQAARAAARVRLRPILMTSLTLVASMLPLSLELAPGNEAMVPLARALLGGMVVSTVLTLILIPCVYVLIHRERPQVA